MILPPPRSTLFPYTTLFRSLGARLDYAANHIVWLTPARASNAWALAVRRDVALANSLRSEEHTSELQSRGHLVCRLLLEKKKDHHDDGDLYASSRPNFKHSS